MIVQKLPLYSYMAFWSNEAVLYFYPVIGSSAPPVEEENRTRALLLAPAFCSRQAQGGERSCTPVFHLLSFFLFSPKCQSRQEQWCKKGSVGVQAREGAKDGWSERAGIEP